MSGGSLGLGLSIAVGMALGLKRTGSANRVYAPLRRRLDQGAAWEATMAGAHWKLENLFAFVDCNNQQADGVRRGHGVRAGHREVEAFGWFTQRIDGNDLDAAVAAFDAAKANPESKPSMIIADTKMGRGVPFLEAREKNHFIRVEEHEWQLATMRSTPGGPHHEHDRHHCPAPKKVKLTTSSIIASIAAEGQATKPAPFGHALVELARSLPRSSV